MNFYFKPHPFLPHWVPGFLLSTAILLRHYGWSYHRLMEYMPASQAKSFLVGLTIVVVAWIAGQALGAARDILEHLWDLLSPIEWDFFFWCDAAEIEKFEEYYFSFYVFCFNTTLALAAMILLSLTRGSFPPKAMAGAALLLAFFAVDTMLLRLEVRRMLAEWSRRPHRGNRTAPGEAVSAI